MRKILSIVTSLALISLTGCSATQGQVQDSPPSVEITAPTKLMNAVNEAYPECTWETFTSRVSYYVSSTGERWFMDENLLPTMSNLETYQPETSLSAEARSGFRWYACNTTGLSVADFLPEILSKNLWSSPSLASDSESWEGLFLEGWGGSCWSPGSGKPDKTQLGLLKACERRLVDKSEPGVWFLIYEEAKTELNSEGFAARLEGFERKLFPTPSAFLESHILSVQAPFDYLTRPVIDALDQSWNQIISSTGAVQASDVMPGYPISFDRANWYGIDDPGKESGSRMDLEQAYQVKFNRYLTCNDSLEVTEFDYLPGDCGKLNVEVFQADLSTGPCMFLGKWADSSGNRKTGLFEFCDAFNEGSMSEDSSYKLKVRIQGATSYQTILGYEKDVLAFTVIGDY